MKIWVDADACPSAVKDILLRVSERTSTDITFVANQWLRLPDTDFVHFIQVEQGPDIADDEIEKLCNLGDLVITADIPLAARVVEKDAFALDPRGTLYNKNNMGQSLSIRNFMDELRGSGVETGGPRSFGQRQKAKFANELDRFIQKHNKK